MRNEDLNHGEDLQSTQPARIHRQGVQCRRTGRNLAIDEHKQCPYCFGRADDIANGQYERFCNYTPIRDPLLLGFQAGATRELEG